MWWNKKEKKKEKKIDISEEIVRSGRKLSDLSNEELIALKNSNNILIGSFHLVVEEFNYRLVNGSRCEDV